MSEGVTLELDPKDLNAVQAWLARYCEEHNVSRAEMMFLLIWSVLTQLEGESEHPVQMLQEFVELVHASKTVTAAVGGSVSSVGISLDVVGSEDEN